MRCRISRAPEHIAQLGISKLAYYTEQKSGCKFYCWFCAQIGNKKGSYSSPLYWHTSLSNHFILRGQLDAVQPVAVQMRSVRHRLHPAPGASPAWTLETGLDKHHQQ